jgi:hypothetical protein
MALRLKYGCNRILPREMAPLTSSYVAGAALHQFQKETGQVIGRDGGISAHPKEVCRNVQGHYLIRQKEKVASMPL